MHAAEPTTTASTGETAADTLVITNAASLGERPFLKAAAVALIMAATGLVLLFLPFFKGWLGPELVFGRLCSAVLTHLVGAGMVLYAAHFRRIITPHAWVLGPQGIDYRDGAGRHTSLNWAEVEWVYWGTPLKLRGQGKRITLSLQSVEPPRRRDALNHIARSLPEFDLPSPEGRRLSPLELARLLSPILAFFGWVAMMPRAIKFALFRLAQPLIPVIRRQGWHDETRQVVVGLLAILAVSIWLSPCLIWVAIVVRSSWRSRRGSRGDRGASSTSGPVSA